MKITIEVDGAKDPMPLVVVMGEVIRLCQDHSFDGIAHTETIKVLDEIISLCQMREDYK